MGKVLDISKLGAKRKIVIVKYLKDKVQQTSEEAN